MFEVLRVIGVARKGTLPLVLYESQTGADLYSAGTFSRLGLATKSISYSTLSISPKHYKKMAIYHRSLCRNNRKQNMRRILTRMINRLLC